MESNGQGASGSVGENGGASPDKEKDVVAYATYSKTIGELKRAKAELDVIKAKEVEREQQALSEQGKYKEALESELKRRKELEVKLADKDKSFARKIFKEEAKSVALQMGAMPEALEDIVKVGDWSSVEIDQETFNINQDQLKESMSKLQKDKPFYFKKDVTSPKTVNTSASGAGARKENANTDLSKEELIAKIKSLG